MHLEDLKDLHHQLTTKAESLYQSLQLPEGFQLIGGVSLDFMKMLLMARSLKVYIRSQCVARFYEWERLDQAVGGKNQALGMSTGAVL